MSLLIPISPLARAGDVPKAHAILKWSSAFLLGVGYCYVPGNILPVLCIIVIMI